MKNFDDVVSENLLDMVHRLEKDLRDHKETPNTTFDQDLRASLTATTRCVALLVRYSLDDTKGDLNARQVKWLRLMVEMQHFQEDLFELCSLLTGNSGIATFVGEAEAFKAHLEPRLLESLPERDQETYKEIYADMQSAREAMIREWDVFEAAKEAAGKSDVEINAAFDSSAPCNCDLCKLERSLKEVDSGNLN